MIQSQKFSEKTILLLDKQLKDKNDRTWCFWEKEAGLFDSIVSCRYDKTWIHNVNFSRLLDLSPYQYKLIRGIDYYNYCLEVISQQKNFTILLGDIGNVETADGTASVTCAGETYTADYIFNSILFNKPVLKQNEYWLLQHFKGFVIEAENDCFNINEATLMDFRVSQKNGMGFIYIMPFSSKKALVEYTLFTEEIIALPLYEEALKMYIEKYISTGGYKVVEEEFGVIPMTNHKFPAVKGNIINIGTAGGQTKGSSGYTFQFIQKHSERLVESLIKKKNPFIALPTGAPRFRFYDSVMLKVLKQQRYPGNKIFTALFKKNDPKQVLRFLDNESNLSEELKIISSLPTWPFLKAAVRQLKSKNV
jgi:lycopene beta-cyclase